MFLAFMKNRLLGGILLIVGTSIGGGILAIPMATAGLGFWVSSLVLVGIWLITVFSAYLILEVNLFLPAGTNLISMARATLGRGGEVVMWVSYLLLLYALLSAYTSGGADIIYNLANTVHIVLANWLNALIFLLIFGTIVVIGIHGVDFANRILLTTKLATFLLVVAFCLVLVKTNLMNHSDLTYLKIAVMPVITSFGFAIIMPSLRVYLDSNVALLRKTILFGSLIPLVCYLLWNFVVQGTIASNQLTSFGASNHAVALLTDALSALTHNSLVSELTHLFTIICVTTSFLGVSLCLVDFLRDGLRITTHLHSKLWPTLLAFIPPLILVSVAPGLFIKALSYAGVMCVVLLMLLPGLMAYRGRYLLKLPHTYEVKGGKLLLVLQILISIGLLVFAIAHI
jgi:tyrosine-specific transport protein